MHRIERTPSGYEAHYFDSLDAFVDAAEANVPADIRDNKVWQETVRLARLGWQDELANVEEMTAHMVDTVERDTNSTHFDTVYGVDGCDVDIDRYLTGEPENMIAYPLADISRAGRVITMAVSVTYSGGASKETVRMRGHVMTAAAIALDRLGLNTEIWADRTIRTSAGPGRCGRPAISQRIMVKGANDTLDPARILYATAHNTMLHHLCFKHARYATEWGKHNNQESGCPQDPEPFLPDGALYLPTFNTGRGDNEGNAVAALKAVLRMAGAID